MTDEIITQSGKTKWYKTTILSMLQNEKYLGNAVLETYKPDVLSNRRLVNEGQSPKYYVEKSHPAIITKEMLDIVQSEITRRLSIKGSPNTAILKIKTTSSVDYILFHKIILPQRL